MFHCQKNVNGRKGYYAFFQLPYFILCSATKQQEKSQPGTHNILIFLRSPVILLLSSASTIFWTTHRHMHFYIFYNGENISFHFFYIVSCASPFIRLFFISVYSREHFYFSLEKKSTRPGEIKMKVDTNKEHFCFSWAVRVYHIPHHFILLLTYSASGGVSRCFFSATSSVEKCVQRDEPKKTLLS